MTVYTSVEFKCLNCNGHILYEDELPIFFKDRTSVTNNNRADKFLKQHPLTYPFDQLPVLNPPPLVTWYSTYTDYIKFTVELTQEKYTICPICNYRIYL